MDLEDGLSWQKELDGYLGRFASRFHRSETRESVRNYVRGLLASVPRKNGWQLAEEVGLSNPHPIQRVVSEAKWSDEGVRQDLREFVIEAIGYEPGIGVLDESGFIKWGKQSAGVSRQYCGRIGKVDNCQVGVYLGYVTPTGASFLDCQLYLPRVWCEDHERCRAAKIPDEVVFQTKPQIAQTMLEQAWNEGIPMQWVIGDTLYGNSPQLREAIHHNHRYYVMEIGMQHQVTLPETGQSVKLDSLPYLLSLHDWEQLCFRVGEQGILAYDWQVQPVILPGDTIGEQRLLIQRTLDPSPTYRFYLSNAPIPIPLTDLVAACLSRHSIEDLFGEAKAEVGMGDYEVRHWHGWHRHMTLVMLAHTFLKLIQHQLREKKDRCRIG